MSTHSFEKNSISWQLHQLQQKFGEWWELQMTQSANKVPEMSWLSWLDSPVVWIVAKMIFWLILALLLSWVILQIMRLVSPYLHILRNQLNEAKDQAKNQSIKELSVAEWLKRAQKFQKKGNYKEACRCLYMAMLQRLNDAGLIAHQVSRTDGEYLQLVQQLPQPSPYQKLLMNHQQILFGNADVSLQTFEDCQKAYNDIQDSIVQD